MTYHEPVTDASGKPVLDAQGHQKTEPVKVTEQVIAVGPAASQIAIKQLGTNGGGFFNVNSAHPFENPTPLSNFLELLAILVLPAAACYTFGRMAGDARQGRAILAAMTLLFLPLLAAWGNCSRHARCDAARGAAGDEPVVTAGDLAVDVAHRLITVGGREVALTPVEHTLLKTLALHAGRVMTHGQLLREVWGPGVRSGRQSAAREYQQAAAQARAGPRAAAVHRDRARRGLPAADVPLGAGGSRHFFGSSRSDAELMQ